MANRHFGIGRWVDFARGLGSREESAAMQDHLDGGCKRCAATLATFRRVVGAAAREARLGPADHAVRSVKALFSLQSAERRSRLSAITLNFETAVSPGTGLRGGEDIEGPRQQIFEAAEFILEVRVDRAAASREGVIAGQLLTQLGEPLEGVPAFLVSENDAPRSFRTGDLGHFLVRGDLTAPAELWFLVEGDRRIALHLGG